MKKNILYLISLGTILAIAPEVHAQSEVKSVDYTVQVNKVEQYGDSLYVDFNMKVYTRWVKSNASADFIPVLIAPDHSQKLPMVQVKGRNNYQAYNRTLALMSKQEKEAYLANPPYQVAKGYGTEVHSLNYVTAVPFEKWMSDARLDLYRDHCECGDNQNVDIRTLASKIDMEKVDIRPYLVTPYLTYVQPRPEAVKQRDIKSEAFLDFPVNKYVLLPEFGNNPKELKKITDTFSGVDSDRDITLTGISITGYASPEGTLARNMVLSENRARALKEYLMGKYSYPAKLYTSHSGGEDWDGLVNLVTASNMEFKTEVLDIITQTPTDKRKDVLMKFQKGAPYAYMLREMYPQLRRVLIQFDFNVRNFNLEEAKEVVKTRPANLSLNELFIVAGSYPYGSPEYIELFETAAKLFPKDPTANLNAGIASIGRGDLAAAERYLGKVKNTESKAEYANAMGLLVLLRDNDFEGAEEYFNEAKALGLESATSNLEELRKKRENANQINAANERLKQRYQSK